MLKRMFAAIALVFVSVPMVALTGCTAGQIATSAALVTTPPANLTVLDEKAWYAAEALYNIPAYAYVRADQAGALTPSMKATIKPKMLQLADLLKQARAAYQTANKASFDAAVAKLKTLSDEVNPLIPR